MLISFWLESAVSPVLVFFVTIFYCPACLTPWGSHDNVNLWNNWWNILHVCVYNGSNYMRLHKVAACLPVYYINGCGCRPLSGWEPRMMWYGLTHHDVSPPADCRHSGGWRLVLYLIAYGRPNITSYIFLFLLRGKNSATRENTPEHNCLQDSCRGKSLLHVAERQSCVWSVNIAQTQHLTFNRMRPLAAVG